MFGLQRLAGNRAVGRWVQRRTAEEVKQQHTDLGGLNLNEEELATDLVAVVRGGDYPLVNAVFSVLDRSDCDDVAQEMVGALSVVTLIAVARVPAGRALLQTMSSELASGWATRDELGKSKLLDALLGERSARTTWNKRRITELAASGNDLGTLAAMFDDDQIVDDGTVASRLEAVLGATAHLAIPGLQTGILMSDEGFAGDRAPDGPGFRDPHPSSRNQPGHFLTATGLQFDPGVVSRPIPLFGSIRQMVAAPAELTDQDVALRLTIGHEKAPDPDTTAAVVDIVATGAIESYRDGPDGETEEQRRQRIGKAIADAVGREVQEVIAAFRTQFQAATDADVAAWNDAIRELGSGDKPGQAAAEGPLGGIQVDPAQRGNSRQDLRLSLMGWRLGQLISTDHFPDRHAVAGWIRANLGP